MSATERIGFLQGLLARVTQRKGEPRPARAAAAPIRTSSGSTVIPQRVTMDIAATPAGTAPMLRAPTPMPGPAIEPPRHVTMQTPVTTPALEAAREPAPMPAAVAPSAVPSRTEAQTGESWGASPPEPRTPSGSLRAPPPQVPLADDDLPDLDLVETTSKTGEKRSSLMPAGAPPGESDGGEFHLPSIRPPAYVMSSTDASIDFNPSADDGSLQIDHSPLASAVAPRQAHDDDMFESPPERSDSDIPEVLEPTSYDKPIAAAPPARSELPIRQNAAEIESPPPAVRGTSHIHDPSRTTIEVGMLPGVPPPSTHRSEPPAAESTTRSMERFVAPQLPDEQLIEMRGVPGTSRGASFRVLLERSLLLRLK